MSKGERIAVAVLVSLMVGLIAFLTYVQVQRQVCIDAGYADRIEWAGRYYCVGVRDGIPIIESFGAIRDRP